MQSQLKANLVACLLGLPSVRKEEAEVRRRAETVLEVFGERLTRDRLLDLASTLSYANRRRLEIARALAAEPRLLLLDEPTAGMNPHERLELMDTIGALRDRGHTVLLIEHAMEVVQGICDRALVMDHGHLIAEGRPEVVLRNPEVVEAYLGAVD